MVVVPSVPYFNAQPRNNQNEWFLINLNYLVNLQQYVANLNNIVPSGTNQATVQAYISTASAYIQSIIGLLPKPIAYQYAIFSEVPIEPTEPTLTTPDSITQQIVDNISNAVAEGVVIYNTYILYIQTTQTEPPQNTQKQLTEQMLYAIGMLIRQYQNKPRASKLVGWIAQYIFSFINFALTIQNGYNLITAVGTQLDILGKYIGVDRNYVYNEVASVLSDDSYRVLLYLQIAFNNSNLSFESISTILYSFFGGLITIGTSGDMELTFYIVDQGTNQVLIDAINAAINKQIFVASLGIKVQIINSTLIGGQTVSYCDATANISDLEDDDFIYGFIDGSTPDSETIQGGWLDGTVPLVY